MKQQVIFLLLLLSFSCSTKEDEIESIEVMTYYYNWNNDQSKPILDCLFYASTGKDGFTQIFRQILPTSQDGIGYAYAVDKKLIDEIENKTKGLNGETFEIRPKVTELKLYCGPSIRFCIKYKSKKIFSFSTDENELGKQKKLQVFNTLYKAVTQNAKTKTFDKNQQINIRKRQKDFESFAINQDTLRMPFPPRPKKVNLIKFIK